MHGLLEVCAPCDALLAGWVMYQYLCDDFIDSQQTVRNSAWAPTELEKRKACAIWFMFDCYFIYTQRQMCV